MMTVIDLFSGICGFTLGLEATGGFKTVQFCEINQALHSYIKLHYPGVPLHTDIRSLRLPHGFADVVVGGFPCQDISSAGFGRGLDGTKSSSWWEMYRIIQEVMPSWAIIENSPCLRSRGLDQILRALAAIGYDAEWHCIPACAVGAHHERDRIFIIAYPDRARREREDVSRRAAWRDHARPPGSPSPLTDALRNRLAYRISPEFGAGTDSEGAAFQAAPGHHLSWWPAQPDVVPMVHGVPRRLAGWRKQAVMALGNAVMPQVVRLIGEAILEADGCGK
ncbi:MAG: DNA cytosine methyltransferase [Magnetococcales bacterium]|nr:DNA cytosine methyltransferase [Magnetococcales bacterium]